MIIVESIIIIIKIFIGIKATIAIYIIGTIGFPTGFSTRATISGIGYLVAIVIQIFTSIAATIAVNICARA